MQDSEHVQSVMYCSTVCNDDDFDYDASGGAEDDVMMVMLLGWR